MAAAVEVRVPAIGDMRDVPVVAILVEPGRRIAVDDPLVALESDKATVEVPSPVAGTVRSLAVAVGGRVSEGSVLLLVEPDGAGSRPSSAAEPPVAVATLAVPPSPAAEARPGGPGRVPADPPPPIAPSGADAGVHASPSVRAFARELGADLAAVAPSGPHGRVLREDVTAHLRAALAKASGPEDIAAVPAPSGIGAGLPAWPRVDFAKYGPVRREPVSRVGRISGANLARNWLTIPHVTNFDRADVTELEGHRRALNADPAAAGVKVTIVAFLLKAAAVALRRHPRFNVSLDGDELVFKDYVDIGFAADTPRGLVVPVIRDCDRKGLRAVAAETGALAERARAGTLPAEAMTGGTFTVSSLGGIGGDGFTPIVNAPEVAILGAGRSSTAAVWDGAAFQPRLVLPLSLSWDHRVVDGVAAARFLREIAAILADWRRAVL